MIEKITRLTKKDEELLHFLWRWKVLTTAALSKIFYAHLAPVSAYKRLWKLEKGGFIQSFSDSRKDHYVWILTKLGFQMVRKTLPELKAECFHSENIVHDLITASVHLGDYLVNCPQNISFFSEQEMRCLPFEFYPNWVPRSEVHRPDGYWNVPIGNTMATIGLEVELSPKKDVRYEVVAHFYSTHPSIVRVLWVVPHSVKAKSLHEKFQITLKNAPMIHNFVSFPNFQTSGWDAHIEYGPEAGKRIGLLVGKKMESTRNLNSEKILLDTKKSAYESKISNQIELSHFRY